MYRQRCIIINTDIYVVRIKSTFFVLVFVTVLSLQVTDRQFLASEAWSTSDDLLKDAAVSEVANGVLGVAIQSSAIPGFEQYLKSLHPGHRPDDAFIGELWQKIFKCSPEAKSHATSNSSYFSSPPEEISDPQSNVFASSPVDWSQQKTSLPPCSGAVFLDGVKLPFFDTSQLRVTYNVYLAVYAAAHALHSLLSCPDRDSPRGNNKSSCSFPKHINPIEVNTHVTVSSHPLA